MGIANQMTSAPAAAAIPVLLPASPPQVLRRSFISSKTIKGLDKYKASQPSALSSPSFSRNDPPSGQAPHILHSAAPFIKSLSGYPKQHQEQPVDHTGADTEHQHRSRHREQFGRGAGDQTLWLCQDRHTVFSEFFQLPPKWGALIVLACRYKFKPARSTHIYLNLS